MTASGDPAAIIRDFLAATDHAPDRLDGQYAGTLNPLLRPRPDKRYPTLAPLPLPREFAPSSLPALTAIADPGADIEAVPATGQTGIVTETGDAGVAPTDRLADLPSRRLDLAAIARLCFFTNGITKRLRFGDRTIAFRAAPCTGALYHQELYLVTGDLADLPAGVYHYGVHDHALRQLRDGDFRAVVVEATGGEAATAQTPAIMVVSSVFWRNAWKYAARAYRHAYWDVGTMLPNTLAVATASAIPARLVLGFADQPLADLLDLDLDREGIIALVALGRGETSPPPAPPVTRLGLPTEPYSPREIDYPLIRQTHRATLLTSGEDASAWRQRPLPTQVEPPPREPLVELPAIAASALPTEPIERAIRRRGSTRRFARHALALDQLSVLLDRTTRGIPSDALGSEGTPLNRLYLIANAVERLPSGTYVYHRDRHALEPLRAMSEAEARRHAYFLALEQDLGGDAAVDIYLMAALDPVLETFGARGYRLAQLGGALVPGKLYLAAYALGLGATGLTFYDHAVTETFSPHAAGKRPMFLIAVGVPA